MTDRTLKVHIGLKQLENTAVKLVPWFDELPLLDGYDRNVWRTFQCHSTQKEPDECMFMIWTLVRGRYLSYGAPGRPYSSVLVFFSFPWQPAAR